MYTGFTFQSSTRVIAGKPLSESLAEAVDYLRVTKALVITDPGLAACGVLKALEDAMKEIDLPYVVFTEVRPNPNDISINKAVDFYKTTDADFIIALGGGSSIDTSKAVAILATNEGTLYDYITDDRIRVKNRPLGLVAVPTTAGSGAEVTHIGALAYNGKKGQIRDPLAAPAVAILAPHLMSSMPKSIATVVGWDALTHALESYLSKNSNPISDPLALEAFDLICNNLIPFVEDRSNAEAAANMLMGSTIACIASCNTGNGNVHGIGRPIQGHYDFEHGKTLAVILPHVMMFNVDVVPEKLATVAQTLGVDITGMSIREAAVQAVIALQDMRDKLGLPSCYKDMGMTEDVIPLIAEQAMHNTGPSPRETTYEDLVRLITAGYNGDRI